MAAPNERGPGTESGREKRGAARNARSAATAPCGSAVGRPCFSGQPLGPRGDRRQSTRHVQEARRQREAGFWGRHRPRFSGVKGRHPGSNCGGRTRCSPASPQAGRPWGPPKTTHSGSTGAGNVEATQERRPLKGTAQGREARARGSAGWSRWEDRRCGASEGSSLSSWKKTGALHRSRTVKAKVSGQGRRRPLHDVSEAEPWTCTEWTSALLLGRSGTLETPFDDTWGVSQQVRAPAPETVRVSAL